MAPGTSYAVNVNYKMSGNATTGMQALANSTKDASKNAMTLSGVLAAVGGVAMLHKAKELLIDFNTEMQGLKNSMTVVMEMNMHMPFEKANAAADKLFLTFQEMAKRSPLLTSDFMEMASAIAPAVSMAGGGVGKLQSMTEGAVKAGLAFHVRPDQMAMDIQEMLGGNVRLTSRTARQLIASQGMDHKEFNGKSALERAQLTEKILTAGPVLAGAERAAHTLAGEISTVKDNIQIAFGEAGLPLMKAMTAEAHKLAQWMLKSPATIHHYVTEFGGMLRAGVAHLKAAAEWFVDNKDTLMGIAKVFLVFKGAQMATGMIGNFAKGITSLTSTLVTARGAMWGAITGTSGVVGSLGKFGIGLLGAVPALAAFTVGLGLAVGYITDHMENSNKPTAESMAKVSDLGNALFAAQEVNDRLKNIPANATGELGTERANLIAKFNDPEFMGPIVKSLDSVLGGKYSRSTPADFFQGGIGIRDQSSKTLGQIVTQNLEHIPISELSKKGMDDLAKIEQTLVTIQNNMDPYERENILKAAFPDKFGPPEIRHADEQWKGLKEKDVNITIQRVEVASEDPDRFVFGLVNMSENAIKHATQSKHSIPGGF